jgi:uncharacterized protein YkwD
MRSAIVVLLWLSVPLALAAAPGWNRDNYKVIDHKTFRKSEVFNKKIDHNNIDYALLNAAIFFLTNEQRAKKKLKPLEYVAELEASAWHHSKQMAEKRFFSHTNSKDKTRRTCDNRAKLAGIFNPNIAENIANFSGEDDETYLEVAAYLVKMWMDSQGHKENILSRNALQLGCGAYYRDGSWYGTQNFQWYERVKAGGAVTDPLP